jgi:hypothetical protein
LIANKKTRHAIAELGQYVLSDAIEDAINRGDPGRGGRVDVLMDEVFDAMRSELRRGDPAK